MSLYDHKPWQVAWMDTSAGQRMHACCVCGSCVEARNRFAMLCKFWWHRRTGV